MAWVSTVAGLYSAFKNNQAQQTNASILSGERSMAINQAASQEGMVRRASREQLGRQAAAFGAAGVGYGGSSETSLSQSAVNQELDALNTRYKGAITGFGYGVQAGYDRKQAQTDLQSGGLLAGAALLKGLAGNGSYGTPSLAQGG